MENSKVSDKEFFCLMLMFVIGTSVVFPIGANAKQAVWISILLGMIGGVILIFVYQYLFQHYPNLTLVEYSKKILGTYIGTIVGSLYTIFFIYAAARNLRDGMILLVLNQSQTPMQVFGIILISIVMYAVYKGVETFFLASQIIFFGLLGIAIAFLLFLIMSDVIQTENLFPILEPGWKVIASTVLQETWMSPFGELIVFTMLFPALEKSNTPINIGVKSVIFGGCIVAFIHALMISVLGIVARNMNITPLLETIEKINVGGFIQRLDSLFLIWLIVNIFIKITVFVYAVNVGATNILKAPKNVLVLPLGVIVLITSFFIAESHTEHMSQSIVALKYVFPIFALYIPIILCMVLYVRKKLNKMN